MELSQEYSTAIHEAGHGIAILRFYNDLDYITIIPNSDGAGHYHRFKPDLSKIKSSNEFVLKIFNELIICMAGITAENLILNIETSKCQISGCRDSETAEELLKTLYPEECKSKDDFRMAVNIETFKFIKENSVQNQIKAVADVLMQHKTVSGQVLW